jgi:acyl-CoA synthetase (AMP-forming)/AMP-acid ligase II
MIATRDPALRAQWRRLGLHGGLTVTEQIEHGARQAPATMLHFAGQDGTTSISIGEVARAVTGAAKGLQTLGLQPGDTVAAQAPHSLENLLFFAAAMRLGLRYVPIVGIYEEREINVILHESGAKAIAVPATWGSYDIPGRMRQLPAPALEHIVVLNGRPSDNDYGRPAWRFSDLRGGGSLPEAGDPNDPAIILFTSGSTGIAKGAIHSHESALAVLRAANRFIDQTGRSPLLAPLPTGHVAGIMAMLQPFVHHIPVVYMERWDASTAIELIARYGVGWAYSTPFHLLGLIDHIEPGTVPTLRHCQIGGAGVPGSLIRRADDLGIAVCRGYGCTEHPTITSCLPDDPLAHRATSDGRASAGVSLRLVDDSGKVVDLGQPGEIVATGPGQFLGYLDEAYNAAAFDGAGWFRTGDVGICDEQGFVAIVDRKKDIIIRGGENIAPKEIEDILLAHPQVGEAAVVGVPDPAYGERIAAAIILRHGAMDLAEVRRHFRAAGVAIQKTPEMIVAVTDLPRTPLGKVHKRRLRTYLAEMEAKP